MVWVLSNLLCVSIGYIVGRIVSQLIRSWQYHKVEKMLSEDFGTVLQDMFKDGVDTNEEV